MLNYRDEGYVAFWYISWALKPAFPERVSLCKGIIKENQEGKSRNTDRWWQLIYMGVQPMFVFVVYTTQWLVFLLIASLLETTEG